MTAALLRVCGQRYQRLNSQMKPSNTSECSNAKISIFLLHIDGLPCDDDDSSSFVPLVHSTIPDEATRSAKETPWSTLIGIGRWHLGSYSASLNWDVLFNQDQILQNLIASAKCYAEFLKLPNLLFKKA